MLVIVFTIRLLTRFLRALHLAFFIRLMIYLRISIGVLALISLLFAPVWVTGILLAVLVIGFGALEAILLALLLDFLYLPPEGLWVIPAPATLATLLLLWVMVPVRKRLLVGRGD